MSRIFVVLLPCLVLLTACPGSSGQETFPAEDDIVLNVRNPDGPVTVTGIDGGTTAVVSWTVHAGTSAADPSDATVEFSGEGDRLNVTVTVARAEVWVDLDITVPSGASFEIDSDAGEVTLDKLTGGGEVSTTSGFVSGAGLAGSITVRVDDAEVALAMTVADGDVISVVAGAGPITMAVPPDTDALLTADTGDGSVIIDPEVPFSGTNAGGSAVGELGAGATATMSLSTGNGNIEIRAR
jgi:hypothetical protein